MEEQNKVVAEAQTATTPVNGFDKFFGITKAHGNFKKGVKTEVIAGITTFMTMVYILFVNAGMFAELDGVTYGGTYIATALASIIGTVLIGLLSKLPLAQSVGMGLNAFFVYTIVKFGGTGLSYANALLFVLADGIVFVILTVTGLKKVIFNAIPEAVRKAIPAGIGLFIALIGLQDAGLVVKDPATGVALGSFNLLKGDWGAIMPLICTVLGVIFIAVLSQKKVRGAILWGILGTTGLYYLLGLTVPGFFDKIAFNFNIGQDFSDFWNINLAAVFKDGFNFDGYFATPGASVGGLILLFATTALAFCLVDMFDTVGTLYGACARGGLLTESGDVPNMNKAMLADAIATCTGAVVGVSTVTTFVESSAGIAEGGKTGLTSMVTALGFLIFMFLSPIATLVPFTATATALIYVGVLMMNGVKEIDWTSPDIALPAFLTVAMMSFTYNISFGIGFGILSYLLIKLFTGKIKDIKVGTVVVALLFLAMFLLTH